MAAVSFLLNGVQMTLDETRVRAAMEGAEPEAIRAHVVEVDGNTFPVKQVFSAATGLDRLDFTTNQARTVLKRLGFNVARIEDNS